MSILNKALCTFATLFLVVLWILLWTTTVCGIAILVMKGFDVDVFWMCVSSFLGGFGCTSLLRELND